MLGIPLDGSLPSFSEAGTLNQTQILSFCLVSPASLFWGSPVITHQGWSYSWDTMPTYHLCGCWRSELYSTYLGQTPSQLPSPFLTLGSFSAVPHVVATPNQESIFVATLKP